MAKLSKRDLLEKIARARIALKELCVPHEEICIVNVEGTFSPCDCGAEETNKPIKSVITLLYPEE